MQMHIPVEYFHVRACSSLSYSEMPRARQKGKVGKLNRHKLCVMG